MSTETACASKAAVADRTPATRSDPWAGYHRVRSDLHAVIENRPANLVLYNVGEAAALLRVTPTTLRNWRVEGIGPSYVQMHRGGGNGKIMYRESDLIDFIDSCSTKTTGTIDVPAPDCGPGDVAPAGADTTKR